MLVYIDHQHTGPWLGESLKGIVEHEILDSHLIVQECLTFFTLPPLFILDMFLVTCENCSEKSTTEKKTSYAYITLVIPWGDGRSFAAFFG